VRVGEGGLGMRGWKGVGGGRGEENWSGVGEGRE